MDPVSLRNRYAAEMRQAIRAVFLLPPEDDFVPFTADEE